MPHELEVAVVVLQLGLIVTHATESEGLKTAGVRIRDTGLGYWLEL